jgi:hypothetical protein
MCRSFPRRTFIEVGSSSSGGEPPQRQAHLLPPSLSVARSEQHAPSSEALLRNASITLPVAVVEALQKEREDALGTTEDAHREVKEEWLAMMTAENIHDATQVEAAHLRMELQGMGHSLSLLLPTGASLWAAFLTCGLDAPCPC